MAISITPFQAHRERVLKKKAAEKLRQASASAEAPAAATYAEFETILYALETDVAAISDTPSGERAAKKAEMIERYRPHVDAYLETEKPHANPVLVQLVIWLLDVGKISDALKYAAPAIEQNQAMPQRFKRNMATTVADEVLAWAEAEAKDGRAYEPYFSDVRAQLDTWAVPDVVKMKYAKFAGLQAYDKEDWTTAEKELAAAEGLATKNNPAKVKTKLDQARKKLSENA